MCKTSQTINAHFSAESLPRKKNKSICYYTRSMRESADCSIGYSRFVASLAENMGCLRLLFEGE